MNFRCLLALAALLLGAWPAQAAEQLTPSEMKIKEALHAVISSQLAAFRAGDYAAAYGCADASIRSQFALAQFEEMVKAGYPAIAHSVSATFGLTFDNGEEAVVNVRVVGADQAAIVYQYQLRRTGEAWRITGVIPLADQTTEV